MDVSGIGLTKDDLGLLINRYRAPGGGGLIDYQKFCDQSNKVRSVLPSMALRAERRASYGVKCEFYS
ncbi:unnamed protein product [Laminaria digitata]